MAGTLSLGMVLFGCAGQGNQKTPAEGTQVNDLASKAQDLEKRDKEISSLLCYQSSMETEYAKRFAVNYYEGGYVLLTVCDGSRFLVIPENGAPPEDLAEDIAVIKRPAENFYLAASAVMDMFRELDALDVLRFSGKKAQDWYIEEAKEAMENGSLLYAGKYNMPDYERIVSEGCSLAIENTMIGHTPDVAEKLESFGIPVLIDYSSYETHPLGRVEWIKFYGALTGREEKAEEAFQKQAAILERVAEEKESGKTVAFFYLTTNGAVNVRKSSDYIPKMIALAGGKYIFGNLGTKEDNKTSINMQMEEFYAAARDADYLIYNSTIDGGIASVEELLEKSEVLKDFKAVKEGNVWCTTSDFYQQSMAVGAFVEDIYNMLSGDGGMQKMTYLYRPEQMTAEDMK